MSRIVLEAVVRTSIGRIAFAQILLLVLTLKRQYITTISCNLIIEQLMGSCFKLGSYVRIWNQKPLLTSSNFLRIEIRILN